MSELSGETGGTDTGRLPVESAEREAALEALEVHREAGRLDSAQYEDRTVAASRARVWADLQLLFADLPAPRPAPPEVPDEHRGHRGFSIGRPPPWMQADEQPRLGGFGTALVAVSPFLAVALFFLTGSWLWFLLIPALGAAVYGPRRG